MFIEVKLIKLIILKIFHIVFNLELLLLSHNIISKNIKIERKLPIHFLCFLFILLFKHILEVWF